MLAAVPRPIGVSFLVGLAIALIAINLVGDTISAVSRHDLRTLAGMPIGAAMIAYLCNRNLRQGIARGFCRQSARKEFSATATNRT